MFRTLLLNNPKRFDQSKSMRIFKTHNMDNMKQNKLITNYKMGMPGSVFNDDRLIHINNKPMFTEMYSVPLVSWSLIVTYIATLFRNK